MTCICILRSSKALATLSICCANRALSSELSAGDSLRARTPNIPSTISPFCSPPGSKTGQSQYPPYSTGSGATFLDDTLPSAGVTAPSSTIFDFRAALAVPFLRAWLNASLIASLQSLSSRISCLVPAGPTIASRIRSVPMAAATKPEGTRSNSHRTVR